MTEIGAVPADLEQGVLAAWRRGGTGIHFFEEGVWQFAVDGDDADDVTTRTCEPSR
jgi:hypothetical protein